jgi:hypothetical protein
VRWVDYMRQHGAEEYELWERLMQGRQIPSRHSEIDSAGDNAEERSAMGNAKSSESKQLGEGPREGSPHEVSKGVDLC